ncbi:MAG: DUF4388 domain-containing protein [Chloroflexia bacterium]
MALVGNLRNFGLSDFLYLADRGYKTGMLVVQRPGDEARLFFQNGKLVYAIQNAAVDPIEEIVYRLFSWTEGEFRFEPDVKPPRETATAPMSIEKVIEEGVRRVGEWSHIRERIPTLDMIVHFTDQPTDGATGVNLTPDEWRVFARINGADNIARIARLAKMSELDACRIICGFMQAGLVE